MVKKICISLLSFMFASSLQAGKVSETIMDFMKEKDRNSNAFFTKISSLKKESKTQILQENALIGYFLNPLLTVNYDNHPTKGDIQTTQEWFNQRLSRKELHFRNIHEFFTTGFSPQTKTLSDILQKNTAAAPPAGIIFDPKFILGTFFTYKQRILNDNQPGLPASPFQDSAKNYAQSKVDYYANILYLIRNSTIDEASDPLNVLKDELLANLDKKILKWSRKKSSITFFQLSTLKL